MAQHKFLIFRMATKETSQIEAGIIDRSQDQESPWTSPGSGKFRVGGVRGAVLRGPAELLLRWPRCCCCLLWGPAPALLLLLGGAAAVGQETRVRPHAAARRPGCRQRR